MEYLKIVIAFILLGVLGFLAMYMLTLPSTFANLIGLFLVIGIIPVYIYKEIVKYIIKFFEQ